MTLTSSYAAASPTSSASSMWSSSTCIVEQVVRPRRAGAQQWPAGRTRAAALLQAGGEGAERKRADDVHDHSSGSAGITSASPARATAPTKPPAKIAPARGGQRAPASLT